MNSNITRYHSCMRCQRRKIKCDGNVPCAACQKGNAECRRNQRNRMATRRRRRDIHSENARPEVGLGTEQMILSAPIGLPSAGADLITPPASGSSRQLLEPVPETIAANRNDCFGVESLLFDGVSAQSSSHHLWPQPVQIFQLWQAYIDNVNPMTNLLHVQTMQRMVLSATSCKLEELPKPSRALLSSVFLSATESLGDEECLHIMMLPKHECIQRLFVMTKECLVDANVMENATTEMLQALVLYLVGSI